MMIGNDINRSRSNSPAYQQIQMDGQPIKYQYIQQHNPNQNIQYVSSNREQEDLNVELERERKMNNMLTNINESLEKYVKELEEKLFEVNQNSQISIDPERNHIYEEKLQTLLQENGRLLDEREGYQQRENEFREKIRNMMNENKDLLEKVEQEQEDKQMWTKKYNELNSNYNIHVEELKKQLTFQRDITLEQEVNSRTRTMILEKEELYGKLQQSELEYQQQKREIYELKRYRDKIQDEMKDLSLKYDQVSRIEQNTKQDITKQDNDDLEQEWTNRLQKKKTQLEQLLKENERLNGVNETQNVNMLDQDQFIKKLKVEKQEKDLEIQQYQRKLQMLHQQNDQQKDQIQILEQTLTKEMEQTKINHDLQISGFQQQNQKSQVQIGEYQQKVKIKEQENRIINDKIVQSIKIQEGLQKENKKLRDDLNTLQLTSQNQEHTIKDQKQKLNNLEKNYSIQIVEMQKYSQNNNSSGKKMSQEEEQQIKEYYKNYYDKTYKEYYERTLNKYYQDKYEKWGIEQSKAYQYQIRELKDQLRQTCRYR